MNPILVMCMGLGYMFNMYRNKPLVREGGVIIMTHPTYRDFHPVQNKYNFLYPNIDEPLICHLYAQHITEDSKRTPYTNYLTIEEHEFLDNYDAEVYHGHMDRIKNYTHIQETRG